MASIHNDITNQINHLRTLLNDYLDITCFGDNTPSIHGKLLILDETPGKEQLELSPALVNGTLMISYTLDLDNIISTDKAKAPRFSTQQLEQLMSKEFTQMATQRSRPPSRSQSPTRSRPHSRKPSTSRSASRSKNISPEKSKVPSTPTTKNTH